MLIDQFGIDPRRAVFIDDVAANADAAGPFGIHGVHFRDAGQLRGELTTLGLL